MWNFMLVVKRDCRLYWSEWYSQTKLPILQFLGCGETIKNSDVHTWNAHSCSSRGKSVMTMWQLVSIIVGTLNTTSPLLCTRTSGWNKNSSSLVLYERRKRPLTHLSNTPGCVQLDMWTKVPTKIPNFIEFAQTKSNAASNLYTEGRPPPHHLRRQNTPRYGKPAGGTYPSGKHTCLPILIFRGSLLLYNLLGGGSALLGGGLPSWGICLPGGLPSWGVCLPWAGSTLWGP